MIKKIILVLILILAILQFVRIDKTNPVAAPQLDFINIANPPEEIKSVLKHGCYDCHSNNTVYPWYANIAPVSFWLKGHIAHAREELNFSTWGELDEDEKNHILEDIIEDVEKAKMPLKSYTWMHQEAKMTEEQKEMFIVWFRKYLK